ncbi:chorismate mutase [Bacillus marinisedimentorum]|uniref:chorismate mutase n=1 Tax=Bacillus marinisedimentorum TaxID=1821260 RepID=UPI000871E623|nr:chorismate mutase [Bacillus marinisedimentorum]
MIRGIRGAVTVKENNGEEIVENARRMLEEVIKQNGVKAEEVVHAVFSVTNDLNAEFPARALRAVEGWKFVPVMCTREIPVPGSLPMCIRLMLTVETEAKQHEINHVYLEGAVNLRPDLTKQ